MKRITVDLDEALYERLRRAAFLRHKSVAAALREFLEAQLDLYEEPQ